MYHRVSQSDASFSLAVFSVSSTTTGGARYDFLRRDKTLAFQKSMPLPFSRTPPETYESVPMCEHARPYDLAREVALHLHWKKEVRRHESSERTRSQVRRVKMIFPALTEAEGIS
jgi:hypothetical protein